MTMTKSEKFIRPLLRKMWSKQFLTFLFFLFLSASFWLFLTLNEIYEYEYEVKVEYSHLPKDVVLTSDIPQSVHIVLRDRGTTLLNYRYGDKLPDIVIPSSVFTEKEGHVRLLLNELLKPLKASLPQSTKIVSHKPDTIDFYYNHGQSKKVPVRYSTPVTAAQGYIISSQKTTPDSVTVFAIKPMLDTLKAVYVPTTLYQKLSISSTTTQEILPLHGVKITPSEVNLSFTIDRLVEKKFLVPISGENFPQGVILRPFPSQVEVSFYVGMENYRKISPEQFTVTVDYNSLPQDGSTKCHLHLKKRPEVVFYARLATEEVEYVLEGSRQ